MDYRELTPSVLLLHDGELAALAAVVEPLGGIDRRGNPSELDRNRIWDVIVASAGRMLELHEHLPETSAVRIAVLDGDSKTLRQMLQSVETDLLVRQPVHPAALRLLILHALYRGPEKRRTTRVSVGARVRFRSGLRRRPAILAELSRRGCRLMVESGRHRAAPDRLVTVVLPPEITNDKRALSLRGHVMRVSSGEPGTDVIAVLFELLRDEVREKVESIVSAHSHGPAILDRRAALAVPHLPSIPDDAGPGSVAPAVREPVPIPSDARRSGASLAEDGERSSTRFDGADSPPPLSEARASGRRICEVGEPKNPEHACSAGDVANERRARPRHRLSRRIVALGDEAARVLIGRDLSVGGMRVDATPGLAMGDQLEIAVHVRSDGQPLVVSAEVARDDGPDGMALRFVDLNPEAIAALAQMISALPTIIEPNDSRGGAGVVVSELVGRRASGAESAR